MRGRLPAAALVVIATGLLAGCESTQSKNARAAAGAVGDLPVETDPFAAMTAESGGSDVSAGSEMTLLHDEIGTAAVVELRNTAKTTAHEVPVLLTVLAEDGSTAYTNATPGIQRSLTHAATVPPGEPTFWINDQIPLTGDAARTLKVEVGAPEAEPPATDVTFTVTSPKLSRDPASGFVAKGFVEHDAPEEQRRVLVSVLARRDGRIVAAGRGVVARAKPGKRSRFVAFFIGQPEGADLTATAQPDIDTE